MLFEPLPFCGRFWADCSLESASEAIFLSSLSSALLPLWYSLKLDLFSESSSENASLDSWLSSSYSVPSFLDSGDLFCEPSSSFSSSLTCWSLSSSDCSSETSSLSSASSDSSSDSWLSSGGLSFYTSELDDDYTSFFRLLYGPLAPPLRTLM